MWPQAYAELAKHQGHEVKASTQGGFEIKLPRSRYPMAQPIARSRPARSTEIELRSSHEGTVERRGAAGSTEAVVAALAGIRREMADQIKDLKSDLTGLKVDLNTQTIALTEQTNTVTVLASTIGSLFEASEKGAQLQAEQKKAQDAQAKIIETLTQRLNAQGLGSGTKDREGSPAARTGQ
jgi:hypothetical protein